MSDLENNAQEKGTKKRPYNLREKKEKNAAYRSLIRPELADELYDKILNIVVVQKKYRDADYSAKDLAKELQTNTRYLSAVVFGFPPQAVNRERAVTIEISCFFMCREYMDWY